MKKKTKKAAKKPRPKTVTLLAWSDKSIVVHEVCGSELDIEIAVEKLVKEVCPKTPECWLRFDGRPTVGVRR